MKGGAWKYRDRLSEESGVVARFSQSREKRVN